MMAEMIWQMISVMMMDSFGDYYCLVLMIQMGPGVMYEMVLAGQVCSLLMGIMMMSGERLWTFCMLIEILHEHPYDTFLCQLCS